METKLKTFFSILSPPVCSLLQNLPLPFFLGLLLYVTRQLKTIKPEKFPATFCFISSPFSEKEKRRKNVHHEEKTSQEGRKNLGDFVRGIFFESD